MAEPDVAVLGSEQLTWNAESKCWTGVITKALPPGSVVVVMAAPPEGERPHTAWQERAARAEEALVRLREGARRRATAGGTYGNLLAATWVCEVVDEVLGP